MSILMAKDISVLIVSRKGERMVEEVWITGKGVVDGKTKKNLVLNITFKEINIGLVAYSKIGQLHMTINRDDLKLLKKAIDKELS